MLGLEPFPDWYVAHLVEIIDLAKICLKDSGSLWVNLGDTYFARWSSIREHGRQGLGETDRQRRRTPMGGYRQEKQLLLVPARFAIAMQERRWILRNDLIWYKPNVPPRPEKDRLRLSHEHFFHFVKRPKQGRARYYYDLAHVESALTDVVTVPAERRPERPQRHLPGAAYRSSNSELVSAGGPYSRPFLWHWQDVERRRRKRPQRPRI